MIAAAQEAVGPRDEIDRHVRHVALGRFLEEAPELVRRRIVLAARARDFGELGRLAIDERRQAVGEQAHAAVVPLAVRPGRAADDVVADHAGDVEALLLRLFGPVRGAEQALLFARDRHEHERRVEAVSGHHARHFHHGGDARGVVVRAGCLRFGIHHVRRHRVVMAAHDVDAVLRSRERGDDVDDLHRLGYAPRRLLGKGVECDLQAPAGRAAARVQLGLDPAPRGADALRVGVGARERVAGVEGSELADARLDARRLDRGDDSLDLRTALLGGAGQRRQECGEGEASTHAGSPACGQARRHRAASDAGGGRARRGRCRSPARRPA